MAYTTDPAAFAAQIAAAKQIAGAHPLWAGIGAYRLSSGQIVENVQAARRLGVERHHLVLVRQPRGFRPRSGVRGPGGPRRFQF